MQQSNCLQLRTKKDPLEKICRCGAGVSFSACVQVLGRLHALRELDISRLTMHDHSQAVPAAFSRLSSLTRLDARKACNAPPLGAHEDFKVPWLEGCTHVRRLRHLDLGGRHSEVGCSIAQLPDLTYLDVSGNGLKTTGLRALSTSLDECPRLRYVSIAALPDRKPPPAAFDDFLLSIVQLTEIEHLDLSNCGKGSLEVTGRALGHLASLRSLVWRKAPPAALPQTGLNFTALTALSSVDLAGTQIGRKDATWDIAWLALLRPTLRSLNLKNTRLFGIEAAAVGDLRRTMLRSDDRLKLEEVAQHLRVLTGLTALNLSGNAYPSMSSVALGDMLAGMRQLRVLKLRTMGLSSTEFAGVAAVLPHFAHLCTLDVGRNAALGTENGVQLARATAGLLGLCELFVDGMPKMCSKAVKEQSGEGDCALVRVLGVCMCEQCDQAADNAQE